jgi:hypothetical protein
MHTIPLHDCDHAYATGAYRPGDLLRHLVQVRDGECTFPRCSRPARESDFEHASHPARAGLAPMARAFRPHLHQRTEELSGVTDHGPSVAIEADNRLPEIAGTL